MMTNSISQGHSWEAKMSVIGEESSRILLTPNSFKCSQDPVTRLCLEPGDILSSKKIMKLN